MSNDTLLIRSIVYMVMFCFNVQRTAYRLLNVNWFLGRLISSRWNNRWVSEVLLKSISLQEGCTSIYYNLSIITNCNIMISTLLEIAWYVECGQWYHDSIYLPKQFYLFRKINIYLHSFYQIIALWFKIDSSMHFTKKITVLRDYRSTDNS